jgi:LPXTG-motif cell wall-anchored protein
VAGPLTGVVGLTSTLLGLGLLSALGLVLFRSHQDVS